MKLSIKQLIAAGVFILISVEGFSQHARASLLHNDLTLESRMQKNIGKGYKSDIKGSPYFDVEFNSATISPLNKVFMVRYNAVLDDMEVIQSTDTLIMNRNNKNYIIKLSNGKAVYKILENADSKEDKLGYFIQLTDGKKVSLYRKDRKKFVEIKRTAYGGSEETLAKFKKQKSEFYVELDNSGNAVLFPQKKKHIIKFFSGKENKIKKFIKENKIKTSKEEDLKKLINYANSL